MIATAIALSMLVSPALAFEKEFRPLAGPIPRISKWDLPRWAVPVRRCKQLLDKNKNDIVAALGDPYRVDMNPYGGDGQYEFRVSGVAITAKFDSKGEIQKFYFELPDHMRIASQSLFDVLTYQDEKAPTISPPDMNNVLDFWVNREQFRRQDAGGTGTFIGFKIEIAHKIKSGGFLLYTTYANEPPVKGKVRFNTETNRRELTNIVKNPSFRWEPTVVREFSLS